jgi:hypothetical protein
MDSDDTLNFSAYTGVRSMIERHSLERPNDAYQQMISGRARFRSDSNNRRVCRFFVAGCVVRASGCERPNVWASVCSELLEPSP